MILVIRDRTVLLRYCVIGGGGDPHIGLEFFDGLTKAEKFGVAYAERFRRLRFFDAASCLGRSLTFHAPLPPQSVMKMPELIVQNRLKTNLANFYYIATKPTY
jgi:hypothetical protein